MFIAVAGLTGKNGIRPTVHIIPRTKPILTKTPLLSINNPVINSNNIIRVMIIVEFGIIYFLRTSFMKRIRPPSKSQSQKGLTFRRVTVKLKIAAAIYPKPNTILPIFENPISFTSSYVSVKSFYNSFVILGFHLVSTRVLIDENLCWEHHHISFSTSLSSFSTVFFSSIVSHTELSEETRDTAQASPL